MCKQLLIFVLGKTKFILEICLKSLLSFFTENLKEYEFCFKNLKCSYIL